MTTKEFNKIEIEDLIEYLKIEDYSYSKSLYLAIRKKNTSDNINFDNNWRIETLDDKYDTVIIPLFDYTGSFLRNKKEIETEHLDKDKNVKSGWGSKNSKNNREWRNALGEKLICNFKDFILENSNNYKNVYVDIYSRVYKDDFKQYMLDNNWDDENDAFEYYLYDEYTINIDSDGIVEFDTLNSNIYDLIGNNMVKLYHFTSSKFENNIRTNGFISGIEKTNPFNNSYSGIYLTTRTTGKEIDGYKHHIVNKHKKDVILITIKMYLDEIEPDMDDIDIQSGKTQFVSDDISPNRIISIEKVIY